MVKIIFWYITPVLSESTLIIGAKYVSAMGTGHSLELPILSVNLLNHFHFLAT
jgi:hypothetical protein